MYIREIFVMVKISRILYIMRCKCFLYFIVPQIFQKQNLSFLWIFQKSFYDQSR